jgi:hypothetical protein
VQGLYFLLTLVAFVIVALWLMQNDPLPPGGRTTGLLRMTGANPQDAASSTGKSVGPGR